MVFTLNFNKKLLNKFKSQGFVEHDCMFTVEDDYQSWCEKFKIPFLKKEREIDLDPPGHTTSETYVITIILKGINFTRNIENKLLHKYNFVSFNNGLYRTKVIGRYYSRKVIHKVSKIIKDYNNFG